MNHHAYFYEGSQALLPALAADAKKRFGFKQDGDPEVHTEEWEKFGIDESRKLVELAALKSTSGRALFILGLASITSEAQQALLKLLEEPQEGSMFVLLVPHGALLGTLRSRMLAYPAQLEAAEADVEVKTFLASAYATRSLWIAAFLNPPAGGEEDSRERVRDFMNGLEAQLYNNKNKDGLLSAATQEGLQDIAHFRGYLSDKAPSLKMILEHLAATLPQMS